MKVDLITFLLIEAVIFMGVIIWRMLKKTEKQEAIILNQEVFIDNLKTVIEASNSRLKEIDENGAFKSDDEIGWFFENVKDIQTALNDFNKNRGYGN